MIVLPQVQVLSPLCPRRSLHAQSIIHLLNRLPTTLKDTSVDFKIPNKVWPINLTLKTRMIRKGNNVMVMCLQHLIIPVSMTMTFSLMVSSEDIKSLKLTFLFIFKFMCRECYEKKFYIFISLNSKSPSEREKFSSERKNQVYQ